MFGIVEKWVVSASAGAMVKFLVGMEPAALAKIAAAIDWCENWLKSHGIETPGWADAFVKRLAANGVKLFNDILNPSVAVALACSPPPLAFFLLSSRT